MEFEVNVFGVNKVTLGIFLLGLIYLTKYGHISGYPGYLEFERETLI